MFCLCVSAQNTQCGAVLSLSDFMTNFANDELSEASKA